MPASVTWRSLNSPGQLLGDGLGCRLVLMAGACLAIVFNYINIPIIRRVLIVFEWNMGGTFGYLDWVSGQMLVEHALSINFLPGFCTVPCVHRHVYVPPLVNVARMHAYIAVTKVHCIATAMVLLLCACLRLVRLPAMHEERPSNAKIAGEIVLSTRILTAGPAVRFPVHVAFTLATVLRSADRSVFRTVFTRAFNHTAGPSQPQTAGGYIMAAVVMYFADISAHRHASDLSLVK